MTLLFVGLCFLIVSGLFLKSDLNGWAIPFGIMSAFLGIIVVAVWINEPHTITTKQPLTPQEIIINQKTGDTTYTYIIKLN